MAKVYTGMRTLTVQSAIGFWRDVRFIRELFLELRPHIRGRFNDNVHGVVPEFSRAGVWRVMLGCLLSSRQRSGSRSTVVQFLNTVPFPLPYRTYTANQIAHALQGFGGLRFTSQVARYAIECLKRLDGGGWEELEVHFTRLSAQRAVDARPSHVTAEREAAWFLANFPGFGPKQSRHFWQRIGLTRYEIPLDSRLTRWINEHLGPQFKTSDLKRSKRYEAILDHVQQLCEGAGLLPCLFDAAAFLAGAPPGDSENFDERLNDPDEWPEDVEIWCGLPWGFVPQRIDWRYETSVADMAIEGSDKVDVQLLAEQFTLPAMAVTEETWQSRCSWSLRRLARKVWGAFTQILGN